MLTQTEWIGNLPPNTLKEKSRDAIPKFKRNGIIAGGVDFFVLLR
jgi:hypothetical protein